MAKEKAVEKGSLADIIKDLNKQYGQGSVMTGNSVTKNISVVSTGSLHLDIATGIGGIPLGGKIIEIFGPESSGKSTLTQTIIGNYQKLEAEKEASTGVPSRKALLCDGENSVDPIYAASLGISLEDLLVIQLDEGAGEVAFDKVSKLVESGQIGLVVIDSYNSLQPKKVMDGEYGTADIGLHAKLMGKSLVKNNGLSLKYGCTFIYLGQIRDNVGVMYGPTQTTQGGKALRFYSHMRMEITRSTTEANSVLGEDKEKLGNLTKVQVIKNKLAPPFKKAEFFIMYGEGIDNLEEIIRLGNEYEILKKRGEIITHNDIKYTVEEFNNLLLDNNEFRVSLEEQIKQKAYATKSEDKEVVETSTTTNEETE